MNIYVAIVYVATQTKSLTMSMLMPVLINVTC